MKRPAVALVLLAAVACRPGPAIERVPDPSPSSASPTLDGPPSATCVNGWRKPAGPVRAKPLDLLKQSQKLTDSLAVDDMRYFTGTDGVERWYAKVTLVKVSGASLSPTSFRLRFLVERRPVGEGIVAVAPYATTGFTSPDWKGFDGEGGSVTIAGVPGRWPGMPTDFVKDGGLPADVAGCLY